MNRYDWGLVYTTVFLQIKNEKFKLDEQLFNCFHLGSAKTLVGEKFLTENRRHKRQLSTSDLQ